MKRLIRNTLFILLLLNVSNLLFVCIKALECKQQFFHLEKKEKILMISPHSDDCVIMGGGLLGQNYKLGGEAKILYLTFVSKNLEYIETRKKEAVSAWRLIDSETISLHFFNFDIGNRADTSLTMAIQDSIKLMVDSFKPTLIVMPLEEKGNFHHDLTNRTVKRIIQNNMQVKVFESAEYNPIYIIEYSPMKIFWFLVRLLPFVPYKEPNYGINPGLQKKLIMTSNEMAIKIAMLEKFNSQKNVIPISQFGYPDLFERSDTNAVDTFHLISKYFSIWTLFTISLIVITVFVFGSYISSIARYATQASLIIIISTVLYIIVFKRFEMITEDFGLLYIMCLGTITYTVLKRVIVPKK